MIRKYAGPAMIAAAAIGALAMGVHTSSAAPTKPTHLPSCEVITAVAMPRTTVGASQDGTPCEPLTCVYDATNTIVGCTRADGVTVTIVPPATGVAYSVDASGARHYTI